MRAEPFLYPPAVRGIMRRDYVTHGAWMTRAYAIGLGAGTQVLTHMPWFIFATGKPGEGARAIMLGAGWVINILFAEWIIRRRSRQAGAAFVSPLPQGEGSGVRT